MINCVVGFLLVTLDNYKIVGGTQVIEEIK